MNSLTLSPLTLELKTPWKLSRNTSLTKNNFIITLDEKYKSEIAPNVRYHESSERIQNEFSEFKSLLNTMKYNTALNSRDWAHSLRFALESAWICKQSLESKNTLEQFLKISPSKNVETSFSLPIMETSELAEYLTPLNRFKSLKIKLNQETAGETVKEVARLTSVPLRLDGNEAWPDLDAYKRFEEKLKNINVEFIEQPLPAKLWDQYVELKKSTPYLIMADESLENQTDLKELTLGFHAVNIKLMKAGSLLLARDQMIQARALGLKTMIGCMIETSLGISYAMSLNSLADFVDLDGFLLIKNDPFHLVRENEGVLSLN